MRQADEPLWPAPAKLNLFLHITGRRHDGYHLLQTVFQFIDIADHLKLEVRTDGLIKRRHEHSGIPEQDDLTIRAARLLQQYTRTGQGVDIDLCKRLPVGGGTGGGSSDAATVLLVLNRLWKTGLTNTELAGLGLQLGADVPVFIYGHACWAEGVGEIFSAIDLPEPTYLLIYPRVPVATAQIFGARELTRNTTPITIADFLAGRAGNDCEPTVRRQFRVIDEAMQWLGQYARVRLTGTGSCIFAEFESEQAARSIAARCPQDWQSLVCRGCNCSPLHQMLNQVTT